MPLVLLDSNAVCIAAEHRGTPVVDLEHKAVLEELLLTATFSVQHYMERKAVRSA